jgi:hypothetical protein
MKLEDILHKLKKDILTHNPEWVYIAVNKYLVTTSIEWENLTDDYDQDLMNIISKSIEIFGYNENSRHNILDLGNSYNFAHPTTNMYFSKIK